MLAAWDGNTRGDAAEPLLYAYFRRALMAGLFASATGVETWEWLTGDSNPALVRIVSAMFGEAVAHLDPGKMPSGGRSWEQVLEPALAKGWADAVAKYGADPAAWRWDTNHRTASRNPLSSVFPGAELDPPSVHVGGDGDTLQCAAYGGSGKNDFVITNLSVYRQVVDFSDTAERFLHRPGRGLGGLPQRALRRSARTLADAQACSDAAGCIAGGFGDCAVVGADAGLNYRRRPRGSMRIGGSSPSGGATLSIDTTTAECG